MISPEAQRTLGGTFSDGGGTVNSAPDRGNSRPESDETKSGIPQGHSLVQDGGDHQLQVQVLPVRRYCSRCARKMHIKNGNRLCGKCAPGRPKNGTVGHVGPHSHRSSTFDRGDRVFHRSFGFGTVLTEWGSFWACRWCSALLPGSRCDACAKNGVEMAHEAGHAIRCTGIYDILFDGDKIPRSINRAWLARTGQHRVLRWKVPKIAAMPL